MTRARKAVIFGAGNVGRGFLGQLFSESGCEVVFVDIDEPLIAALNARQGYNIRLVDNEWADEVTVSPVRALHAEQADPVAQALVEADVGATAVDVRTPPQIASLIVARIAQRAESQVQTPLNIIVCENLKDAAATFRRMVNDRLPPTRRAYLRDRVGFVDTVIGRMVPPPTPETQARDRSLLREGGQGRTGDEVEDR